MITPKAVIVTQGPKYHPAGCARSIWGSTHAWSYTTVPQGKERREETASSKDYASLLGLMN